MKQLLAALILWQSAGFCQISRELMIDRVYSDVGEKRSYEDMMDKRRKAIAAQRELDRMVILQESDGAPGPAVEQAAVTAQQASEEAKAAGEKVLEATSTDAVPAGKIKQLHEKVQALKAEAASNALSSRRLFGIIAAATILLSFVAGLAGLFKRAVLAGVLSLAATATAGGATGFHIEERADYDDAVLRESTRLANDVELDLKVTEADYHGYVARLGVIVEKNGPSAVKSRQAAQDLLNELTAATPPHRD